MVITISNKGAPNPRVVAESIATRPHDQRIALMANWSEEVAACAYGRGHQESVRSHLPVRSEVRGDRGHALPQARSIARILLPRITVLNTILMIVKEPEVGNHPMATT